MARFIDFTQSRNIRIFISSTFQDMKGERDNLLKKVFPKLREIASQRNVTLTMVDLRWGITEEEAYSKRVLELCLKEIDNSIPFFIGIVGDRYGWCPSESEVTEYCLESYKDIRKYLGMKLSITEMEIQYGVLEREEDIHACFYIKKTKRKLKDKNFDKLTNLKQSIKNQQRYPVSEYASLDELSNQVVMNFIDLIDELFPFENMSTYTKQVISQEYVLSYHNHAYVPVQSYYKSINDWISKDDTPFLVIHGESGMGKSALLAGWIDSVYKDSRHLDLHYYFTNNSRFMNSSAEILCYIYKSIEFDDDDSLNVGNERICELISATLESRYESSSQLPIIIIDGIDQLYRDELSNLVGALHSISRYSKIIVSTKNLNIIPELDIADNADYLEVVPLLENDKHELIRKYLSLYGKKMTDIQKEMIIADKQCDNTMVLRSLLDELLTFGVAEKLTERIRYYLSTDLGDFYDCLLNRYEEDFGKELTSKLLSLIYLSRNGLTETDLKAIAKVRNIDFSEFITAFSHQLICKHGKITFSHNRISNAVCRRYVDNDKDSELHIRKLIVKYFKKHSVVSSNEELAWQLYMLNDHVKLYKFLLEYKVVSSLPYTDFYLFIKCWMYLAQNGYSCTSYLRIDKCQKDDHLMQFLSDIALIYLNDEQSASKFRMQITDNFNNRGKIAYEKLKNILYEQDVDDACIYVDRPFNPKALCNRAEIALHQGEFSEALDLYYDALGLVEERMEDYPEDISLKTAEIDILIKYADAMGNKESAINTYHRAYLKLNKLKSMYPDLDMIEYEIRLLGNLGSAIYKDDSYKGLEYLNTALELQKTLGLCNETSVSLLMNLGVLYDEVLRLDLKALEYYNMALDIQLSLTGEINMTVARLYRNIFIVSKNKEAKIVAYNKSRDICTALNASLELANLYEASASEFFNNSFYQRAFKDYMNCLRLRSEELGKMDPLTMSAFNDAIESLNLITQLGAIKHDDPDMYDTEILIAASRVGFHNAQYELAVRLFNGEHIQEDKDNAVLLLKSSAEKGYLPASKMLAELYLNGIHVQKDYQKCFEYLLPVADSDDYEVEYYMGLCYEFGYGVEADTDRSICWYQKSSEKGYANSYNPLAKLLSRRGDNASALKWAKLAASNFPEDWNCAYTLAFVYESLSQLEHALNYYKVCIELQIKHNAPPYSIVQTESHIDAVMLKLIV